jgi:hypothetical protein
MKKGVPLHMMVRELHRRHGDTINHNYRTIYSKVLSGEIPAQQRENGRWEASPENFDMIAEKLKRC